MRNEFTLVRNDDKPYLWCSFRQIERIRAGGVKGLDEVDLAAILEGQADSRLRSYRRRVRGEIV